MQMVQFTTSTTAVADCTEVYTRNPSQKDFEQQIAGSFALKQDQVDLDTSSARSNVRSLKAQVRSPRSNPDA
jgi:hypothetical protein